MAKMDEKEQTKCLKEVRLLESLEHPVSSSHIFRQESESRVFRSHIELSNLFDLMTMRPPCAQGIIRYEEAFIEEADLVIVCEWASGGDLRRVIRRANEEDPPKLFSDLEVWEHFLQVKVHFSSIDDSAIMCTVALPRWVINLTTYRFVLRSSTCTNGALCTATLSQPM